jgi:uncharacterized integral membrane protein
MKKSFLTKIGVAASIMSAVFMGLTAAGVVSIAALIWEWYMPGAGVGLLRSFGAGAFLYLVARVLKYFGERAEKRGGGSR